MCVALVLAHQFSTRRTLPGLAHRVEPFLQHLLGREVSVGRVRLSGVRALVIEEIAIADGDTFRSGTLFRASRIRLSLSPARLLHGIGSGLGLVEHIRLESPRLTLVRRADGGWNVADLPFESGALAEKDVFRAS
ncbi:MAG: hypothetical protein QHJ73_13190, partial [Armatimonadota bacterium]|nr:hypothetical protein [Armatimonadota bacterium]